MKTKKLQIFSLIIGIILLVYVLSKIDYSQLSLIKFNLDHLIIFLIFMLTVFIFVIRTIRWRFLLRAVGVRLGFKKAYVLTASSIALSIFTPAQSGDVMKLEFLKSKYGVLRRDSFSTIMLEKAEDLFFIGLVTFIFIIYQGKEIFDLDYRMVVMVVVLLLLVLMFLVSYLRKRFSFINTVVISFKRLSKKPSVLIISFILTLIYWLTTCLIWVLLAKMLRMNISFLTMLFVLSATIILGFITMVPGAIGVMEISSATLISLLTSYNFSQSILFGLMARFEDILIFVMGYFHLFFLRKRKKTMGMIEK